MNADETTDRILAAAATLFAERGYVAATTSAIAAAAGVNEVTLFRRFGSKEGLVRTLIAAGSARYSDPQTADIESDSLPTILRTMAQREVRDSAENGGLAIRLAFDARSVPEIRDALGDALPSRMRRFADYLRTFQKEGVLRNNLPAEVIAEAFFALTSSFVMYRIATGSSSFADASEMEQLVDDLLAVFWTGAAGPVVREPES